MDRYRHDDASTMSQMTQMFLGSPASRESAANQWRPPRHQLAEKQAEKLAHLL
jgi:hypothetical protein